MHYSDIYILSQTGLGRYMFYMFDFQVICSLWGCDAEGVVFVFHQWVFGLAACFCGQSGGGDVGFAVWVNGPQQTWFGCGRHSHSGGKGAKACPLWEVLYSLKTPTPSLSTTAGVQWNTVERVLLTFSEIAWKHLCSARAGKGALQLWGWAF